MDFGAPCSMKEGCAGQIGNGAPANPTLSIHACNKRPDILGNIIWRPGSRARESAIPSQAGGRRCWRGGERAGGRAVGCAASSRAREGGCGGRGMRRAGVRRVGRAVGWTGGPPSQGRLGERVMGRAGGQGMADRWAAWAAWAGVWDLGASEARPASENHIRLSAALGQRNENDDTCTMHQACRPNARPPRSPATRTSASKPESDARGGRSRDRPHRCCAPHFACPTLIG